MGQYDYPKLDLKQGDIRHNLSPIIGFLRFELDDVIPDYLNSQAEKIVQMLSDKINEIDTAKENDNE